MKSILPAVKLLYYANKLMAGYVSLITPSKLKKNKEQEIPKMYRE